MNNRKTLFIINPSLNTKDNTETKQSFSLRDLAHAYRRIMKETNKADIYFQNSTPAEYQLEKKPDDDTAWFLSNPEAINKMAKTLTIDEIEAQHYNGAFFIGGYGIYKEIKENHKFHKLIRKIWEDFGVLAAVGHGIIGLMNIRLSDGRHLVEGRHMTCYSNKEEKISINMQSFNLENELSKLGGRLEIAQKGHEKVVRDGRFLTGQNSASVDALTDLYLKILLKK